jgi:hypothetical protein
VKQPGMVKIAAWAEPELMAGMSSGRLYIGEIELDGMWVHVRSHPELGYPRFENEHGEWPALDSDDSFDFSVPWHAIVFIEWPPLEELKDWVDRRWSKDEGRYVSWSS